MSVNEFLSIVKESNYNLVEIYNKAPNESLIVLGIGLFVVLLIVFFIRKTIKTSSALTLVDKIHDSKNYDDYNRKISTLIEELPKRGIKVANVLNASKEHILLRTSKLLANMNIEQKVEKYLEISKQYELLLNASKKYNIEELEQFYETKSKELLEVNLAEEIAYYYLNTHFSVDEIKNINAIVKYANSLENPDLILEPMIDEINKFSYGYNLELFKFIEKLDEKESKQVFDNCSQRVEELLTNGKSEVSINILDYLLEKNENEKVYNYISTLTLCTYLQQLYNLYFNKKDNIDLDLAFIANPTKINSDYKLYLDEALTSNWRDAKFIDFISKADGVIDVLGHVEYRTLIERIDNISIENENKRMVEEALAIAKRAESIALEAKSLNKRPVIIEPSVTNKPVN